MARELTNSYNKSLKYSGINSTQIPILALLNIYNEIETAKIAKLLNLEPSTYKEKFIYFNKKKLIKIVKRDVNGNHLKLTTNGYKKLKETLPIWRKSSKKSKKLLDNYIKVLKEI